MPTVGRLALIRVLWGAVRGSRRAGATSTRRRLGALPRMLRQGITGRYPHLDKRRMVLAAAAVVYIVSPIDLIPELFLPVIGLADDAAVAVWLIGAILAETDAFLRWEAEQARIVEGDVIPDRAVDRPTRPQR